MESKRKRGAKVAVLQDPSSTPEPSAPMNPGKPADKLRSHPLADLLPMMSEREIRLLRADILKNGQQEPIVLLEDKILDGRNRYRACLDVGTEPKTVPFDGDATAALEYVIAKNIHRRQLSASQKAIVALKCLPHIREEVGRARIEHIRETMKSRKEIQALLPGTTRKTASNLQARDLAGLLVGVSGRSVQYAQELAKKDPEMVAKVMSGEMPLAKALQQAQVRPRNPGRPPDPIGTGLKRLIRLLGGRKDLAGVLTKLNEAKAALEAVRGEGKSGKNGGE